MEQLSDLGRLHIQSIVMLTAVRSLIATHPNQDAFRSEFSAAIASIQSGIAVSGEPALAAAHAREIVEGLLP